MNTRVNAYIFKAFKISHVVFDIVEKAKRNGNAESHKKATVITNLKGNKMDSKLRLLNVMLKFNGVGK